MSLCYVTVVLVDHDDENLLETYLFFGESNEKIGHAAEAKAREIASRVGCMELEDEETFESYLEDGMISCDCNRAIYITWPEAKEII